MAVGDGDWSGGYCQKDGDFARADRQQYRGQGTVGDDDRGGGHQAQVGASPKSRPLPQLIPHA